MHVKHLLPADYDAAANISLSSFKGGPYLWERRDFARKLAEHSTMGVAVSHLGTLMGYLVYHASAARLDVVAMAVLPRFRRMGVGSLLLQALMNKCERVGASRYLCLEVSERDLDVHKFLRKVGLKAVRVIRGKLGQRKDDAYVFEYRVAHVGETQHS